MISYHEVIDLFEQVDIDLKLESIHLEDAPKRILAEDIYSDINMPPFDKSAMDGYACIKEDLSAPMKCIGTLHAGSTEKYTLKAGECIKIMTGAPVPKSANIVIMVEHTEETQPGIISFTKKDSKRNICNLGEDVRKGDLLLEKGLRILPQHIATLASAGYAKLQVYQKPRVAILSTGSELVDPANTPSESQIRNSNAYNLLAQLKDLNIHGQYAGIVADKEELIKGKLIELLNEHDLIILTGGASVGEHDYVPKILGDLNLDIQFNRVAIQPGKPVSFARGKNKYCFGLSGNPVSSFLQFEILTKAFIYKLMGHSFVQPIQLAPLAKTQTRKRADRLKFFPVRFNDKGYAEEIKFNGSAHISGLSNADGLGLFPKNCTELASEDLIEVLRIR